MPDAILNGMLIDWKTARPVGKRSICVKTVKPNSPIEQHRRLSEIADCVIPSHRRGFYERTIRKDQK